MNGSDKYFLTRRELKRLKSTRQTELEINESTTTQKLEHNGFPVLILTVSSPVAEGGKAHAAKRMNSFYRHTEDAFAKHLRKRVLPMAAKDFDAAVESSRPFNPYRIKISFENREEEGALEIRRRVYMRLRGGSESEYILVEIWDKSLGLPNKITSKRDVIME